MKLHRLLSVLLLLATVPLASAAQRSQSYGVRSHETRILEPDVASAIVQSICDSSDSECATINVSPSSISVSATPEVQARIAAALAEAQEVPSSQVFQLTMIEAGQNGDAGLGEMPEAARVALEDARPFLPFNAFELLGSAVMRTNSEASAMVPGPGTAEYLCKLRFHHSVTAMGRELVIRNFSLSRMPPKLAAGTYAEGASAIDVLETSFGMKPGETVVVGTSKLEASDKALVVLLTAVE